MVRNRAQWFWNRSKRHGSPTTYSTFRKTAMFRNRSIELAWLSDKVPPLSAQCQVSEPVELTRVSDHGAVVQRDPPVLEPAELTRASDEESMADFLDVGFGVGRNDTGVRHANLRARDIKSFGASRNDTGVRLVNCVRKSSPSKKNGGMGATGPIASGLNELKQA